AGRPVHREGVERVGEVLPVGQRVGGAEAVRAGVAGAVDGAVHGAGLLADVLHRVDLAAGGPADAADVAAQHPERRPHALAVRDLDAGLEVAVLLGEAARGVEPGRGVLAGAVPAAVVGRVLLAGGDDQVAVAVQGGVAGAVGVVLELVVAV